jgi:hypothetical protein
MVDMGLWFVVMLRHGTFRKLFLADSIRSWASLLGGINVGLTT